MRPGQRVNDGSRPYPWTRLGYTYDWGSGSHVGMSEYVIPGGMTVQVKAVYETSDYFR